MISLPNILIGVTMVTLGILGVKYTFQVANFTGPQDWLERFTGPGSTYGIYKIFFVIVVIIGIIITTGLGNNVMNFFFAPLRGIFAPTLGN